MGASYQARDGCASAPASVGGVAIAITMPGYRAEVKRGLLPHRSPKLLGCVRVRGNDHALCRIPKGTEGSAQCVGCRHSRQGRVDAVGVVEAIGSKSQFGEDMFAPTGLACRIS